MTGHFRRADLARLDDAALEAALIDLGGALEVPAPADVSRAVGARLRGERLRPRHSFRFRWALIAALLALLALAAIAAGRGFGLPGLRIFFETPAPTATPAAAVSERPSPRPTPLPSTTGVSASPTPVPTDSGHRPPTAPPTLAPLNGVRTTLAEARRAVAFTIQLPPRQTGPQYVYLDRNVSGGEVVFVYTVPASADTADLPAEPDGPRRVEFVLTETRGEVNEGLLGKSLGPGNTITPVDIGRGASGLWIQGPVHRLLVFDGAGNVRETATRDVGNVLAWVRGGVLYRIETNRDLDGALAIARSMP